ncbi:MAG: DUF6916 family protein [Alphaproteobacteria bacterium]
MAKELSCDDFTPHVERSFKVAGGHHTLVLVSATPLESAARPADARGAFILIFRGPPGDVLPEGTHTLEAEDRTSFTFHIIPIHTPAPDRQDYQVVFN